MKKLICIYDSKLATKDTHSFMKAIQKGIEDVEFLDVNNPNVDWERYLEYSLAKIIEVLSLRPIQYKYEDRTINCLLYQNLENQGLPLVVEAILRTLGDIEGKEIVVINQSENLGIPLVKELMRRKATVHSFGSKTNVEFEMVDIIPDWIVTATGDETFKLDKEFLRHAKVIDLSNDTNIEDAIRNVNIVEVLKERLK